MGVIGFLPLQTANTFSVANSCERYRLEIVPPPTCGVRNTLSIIKNSGETAGSFSKTSNFGCGIDIVPDDLHAESLCNRFEISSDLSVADNT